MKTLSKDRREFSDMRVAVHENWARNAVELFFILKHHDGDSYIIEDIPLKQLDPSAAYTLDSYQEGIYLPHEVATQLMNALWQIGLRPSDGIASVGQIEAMQAHIGTLKKANAELEKIVDRLLVQHEN